MKKRPWWEQAQNEIDRNKYKKPRQIVWVILILIMVIIAAWPYISKLF